MQVFWHSLAALRRIGPTPEKAAILIMNPGTAPLPYGFRRTLVLTFWDVQSVDRLDAVLIRLLGGNAERCTAWRDRLRQDGSWPWRPPLPEDAEAVRRFVDSLPEEVCELHVACEYGRARSRAIAEWAAARLSCPAEGDRSHASANALLAGYLAGRSYATVPASRRDRGTASALPADTGERR